MSVTAWEVAVGVGLDLALGDPRWFPHPVRGLGWLVARAETIWRRTGLPLRLAGIFFWACMVAAAGGFVWLTLALPWVSIFWIWTLLALRGLDVEATRVLRALEAGDLAAAREKLSWIVGRDTAHLEEPEILRAAIETIAENLSDAVVAPLFYLGVAGPVGMAVYKAVNTLDSMAGYRNERYREFGWASARLDDVANFVPARLSAGLVWFAAGLLGYDVRRAVRVTWRDGASQPSPNAGYPEAAFAGALGVRLGGMNTYRGVQSNKAYLGDPVRPLDRAAFRRARKLLYASGLLMAVLVCGARAWK